MSDEVVVTQIKTSAKYIVHIMILYTFNYFNYNMQTRDIRNLAFYNHFAANLADYFAGALKQFDFQAIANATYSVDTFFTLRYFFMLNPFKPGILVVGHRQTE